VGVVRGIDEHEALATPHELAGVDQPRDDLPRDAKTEVALNSGGHQTRIGVLGIACRADFRDLNQSKRCPRVGVLSRMAGRKVECRESGNCDESSAE
jgi:hypothetical protein